jgi:hypothetical protein
MKAILISWLFAISNCSPDPSYETKLSSSGADTTTFSPWQLFLQKLPIKNGPIRQYNGELAVGQNKHYALVNYDVGTRDLQQCADFIMRLRAEYLFANKKFNEISFSFTDGQKYSFNAFLSGLKPVVSGNKVILKQGGANENSYASFRKYLDIVYTYAGTVSLNKDLVPASDLTIGTVIITPGTPGHCMIVVDEALVDGKKKFKLAESYMPAQTPYILKNKSDGSPWHLLEKGMPINTASFDFQRYNLKKFE